MRFDSSQTLKIMALFLVVMLAAGCGAGNDATDPGSTPDAVDDPGTDPGVAQDEGATDPGEPDAGFDPGAPDDGASDTAEDPGPEDPGEPDPGYVWASGCEEPGTGAVWVPADPDAIEPDPGAIDPDADATEPVDPFLRHPFIQMSDRNTATVVWRMAEAPESEGCVEIAHGEVQRTVCGTAGATHQFEVRIDDLPPETEITYAVVVGEDRVPGTTFRTMPERPAPMRFAVFADAHNNEENLYRFAQTALALNVDFVVSVGDQAGSGQPWEFDIYFRGLRDLASRVNVWAVLGNHDEKNLSGYFDAFVLPEGNVPETDDGYGEGWWAHRIGNVWLGGGWVRDFYVSVPESDWGEVGWYREQFQKNAFQTAQWRLFFVHQPPYVLQWSDECNYDGEDCLKVALVPLMEEFGIQASFHGHMHGIEYGEVADGVWTFVAGGLGGGLDDDNCSPPEGFPSPWWRLYQVHNFALVETGCDAMTVRYMDIDGNELGRIVLDDEGNLLDHDPVAPLPGR